MPAPESSHRYQPAVWWPKGTTRATGIDGYGQPLLTTSIPIRWRLDDSARQDVMDAESNRIRVDATAIVDVDMSVGDEVWPGAIEDWIGTSGTLSQTSEDDYVYVVKTFNKTPDIRNRYHTRKVGLMRKSHERNPNEGDV